jgi:hypothetical protein
MSEQSRVRAMASLLKSRRYLTLNPFPNKSKCLYVTIERRDIEVGTPGDVLYNYFAGSIGVREIYAWTQLTNKDLANGFQHPQMPNQILSFDQHGYPSWRCSEEYVRNVEGRDAETILNKFGLSPMMGDLLGIIMFPKTFHRDS